MLFLVYKLASYSFLVCACTMSCSYSLVLVVSSAVAFPTVPCWPLHQLNHHFPEVLCFFWSSFFLQDALIVFLHFSSSNAKSMWPSLLIFFFLLRFLCFWERKYLNVKYIILWTAFLEVFWQQCWAAFCLTRIPWPVVLKVFYIQFPQKNPTNK